MINRTSFPMLVDASVDASPQAEVLLNGLFPMSFSLDRN